MDEQQILNDAHEMARQKLDYVIGLRTLWFDQMQKMPADTDPTYDATLAIALDWMHNYLTERDKLIDVIAKGLM